MPLLHGNYVPLITNEMTTQEIVEAVESHPFRWENITLESALSLPVPVPEEVNTLVGFFWYPVGGPRDGRVLGVPYYRVLVDPRGSLDDIQFLPLLPVQAGFDLPPNALIGPAEPNAMTRAEYDCTVTALYESLDQILSVSGSASPVEARPEALSSYRSAFDLLAEKPLLPAYRTLSPAFLRRLETLRTPG